MTDTKRAQNVCHACMLRKKACDKILPACGFCASRRLRCRYDVSIARSKDRRAYNAGRHFVPLRSPSPSRQLLSPENPKDHTPRWIHPSSLYVLSQSVDESLNQLAQHLIELTKLTYDSIIDRYFEVFHQWLPVVSPNSFRHEASRYREEGRLPPADFTVLLLAILLIVVPALDPSLRPPRAKQEFSYMSTKSAFSQAQASMCTSLRLIQAALLIALREYTFVRPEAAYISVMTCAGLARVLGTGITSVRTTREAQEINDSRVEKMERENLAWGIAMLERLILCEMDQRDLQPQTEYPGPDCRLPSDLKPTAGLDSQPGPNSQTSDQVTLSNLNAVDAGQFRRQAQSVFLLDRLLFVMRLPATKKETKLAELAELDSQVRRFLEVVMGEPELREKLLCVPVALSFRLLFLLHGSVLDTLHYPESETDRQKREMSLSGLDIGCRMVLDVVHCYGEEKASTMPICSFYNLRAARQRMQERDRLVVDEALSRDLDSLLRAEDEYRKMWVI